jgi:alkyl sulfatase BDS1-like metallo-beta-lactamase superfamily hydrolase
MTADTKPPLSNLVRAGDAQTAAIAITPFIWQANDISNAYLVNTADGDLMVNTGFMDDANQQRNLALLAPHRSGPLRHIVLTQSHADHFGGVPVFKEAGTKVIGGPGYNQANADMLGLQAYFGKRSRKLWGSTLQRGSAPKPAPEVVPDVLVDRTLTIDQGGRTFELISAPDGETVDNLIVWMPQERIAFCGNITGPVWNSMPFLCTLRGDKLRMVWNYLKSMEKLRDLNAEIVITGHGEPIRGKDRIRADIERMIGAVAWIRDYTHQGMIEGKTVHQLMREVQLPEHLTIGEFHGKVSWAVKSIWEEYSGWFHYEDGTTELYGVPRSAVHEDLIRLAGADALAAQAQKHIEARRPLEAIHLTDIVLSAKPNHRAALVAHKAAHEALLEASGSRNLSETMWLRSEIAAAAARLGEG